MKKKTSPHPPSSTPRRTPKTLLWLALATGASAVVPFGPRQALEAQVQAPRPATGAPQTSQPPAAAPRPAGAPAAAPGAVPPRPMVPNAVQPLQGQALALYNQALAASRSGDHANAARMAFDLASLVPNEHKGRAWFLLSQELGVMGMPYSAALYLTKIIRLGPTSDFFRIAFERLAKINNVTPLGKAAIREIVETRIDPITVPVEIHPFYFFYRGLEKFDNAANVRDDERKKALIIEALSEFSRVPEPRGGGDKNTFYFVRAQYYIGVIQTMRGDLDTANGAFRKVLNNAPTENLKELAIMDLGRVAYEQRNYRKALEFYSQIPRDSDKWLDSLFEGAWTFFMMQKHNETLGNIHTLHSPFYAHRFYPETYILSAITYLRLCRYDDARDILKVFVTRYKTTFNDLNLMFQKYYAQQKGFYNLVLQYKQNNRMPEFPATVEIIDSIARSDGFKEAQLIIARLDKEKRIVYQQGRTWETNGLNTTLHYALDTWKDATHLEAGRDFFSQAFARFQHLRDQNNQIKLIELDILSGRTDELRAKLQSQETAPQDATIWGEGMKPLDVKNGVEYWPFEGEYWEDELGGYVYNISSRCPGARKGEGK